MTPRMSSSRTRVYFCSSSLTSVPPYLLTSTRSPTFTSKGWILPSSSFLPVPRAMTSASWGFSLAESGMMMPPRTCSLSSRCLTRTRSPIGLILTLAIWILGWRMNRARGRLAPRGGLFLGLFVVDDLEVGVDNVSLLLGLGLGLGARAGALGSLARGLRSRLGFGVELGARLAEALEGRLHPVRIVALQGLLGVGQDRLDLRLPLGRQLVARFLHGLLKLVNGGVELVPGLHGLAALLVLCRVQLGLLGHLLDLVLGEPRGALDSDLLVLAGSEVLSRDMQDT